jgi:hypothetical protein
MPIKHAHFSVRLCTPIWAYFGKRHMIINAVCDFYAVTAKKLMAVRRGTENEPRDVAIYLCRAVCGEPLMAIGAEFGMTRHSSVSSAVDRIKKKQATDRGIMKRLDNIVALVQKGQTEIPTSLDLTASNFQ